MPSFTQTKLLPHDAKMIYDLVMDIEKYPEFLPWCKAAQITTIISENNLEADLLINFKNFFEKYSSNVHHGIDSSNRYFIDVKAIRGPFKNLINRWKINAIDDSKCQVEFFIEFEFNSIFLTKLLGGFFEKATHKMMTAFEERAQIISETKKRV